jgi:hypothetical protein
VLPAASRVTRLPMRQRKITVEAGVGWRGTIACVLLAICGCNSSAPEVAERPAPTIIKQPVAFASHTFDPASPPPEMPPLSPVEVAECDSSFVALATLRARTRDTDSTHAIMTIAAVTVTLRLNINIWVPIGAEPRVIAHEDGHRQVSEHYYETADKIAARIAANYIGRRVEISGADLNVESNKVLQQLAEEITQEYNKELNPEPAQLLYDNITDHGRSDTEVKDAVEHALKNVGIDAGA